MLAKFKRPSLYINHGVWVFRKGFCYPIKRKILQVEVTFNQVDYAVTRVYVDDLGWRTPEQVYMTHKETLPMQATVLKHKLAYTLTVGNSQLDIALRERSELLSRLKALDAKLEDCKEEFEAKEGAIKKAIEKTQELWEREVRAKGADARAVRENKKNAE